MSNLNMPVKYCTDENDEKFSPVVYQESMFNDDGTRMNPVPRKMFAKAYDPTKTYPTESLFCIQDNKYYKFTGSGTTTGTFDSTKWTETDDATELTALNSTLSSLIYKRTDETTISVTSGTVFAKDIDVTVNGYTCIGQIGLLVISGAANLSRINADIYTTANSLKIQGYPIGTGSVTIRYTCLYVKNVS